MPSVSESADTDNRNTTTTTSATATNTKTHNDYSLTEDMKEVVSLWDTICRAHERERLAATVRWPDPKGKLLTEKEWVSKVMSKKNYGLCKKTFAKSIASAKSIKVDYRSLCRYTRDDRSKRTSVGTRLGRRPRKSKATLEQEAALQNHDIMRSFYDSIRQGGTTALQIVGEERRQHEKGLEQLRHARKMKTYSQTHRTPEEKRYWRGFWKYEVARLCRETFDYGDEYLKEEMRLMRECEYTHNSLDEIYYIGPDAWENEKETEHRRELMKMMIEQCKLIHTRRCLSVPGKLVLVVLSFYLLSSLVFI